MKQLLLIVLFSLPIGLWAQPGSNGQVPGTVEIILDDPYIDSLMHAYKMQAEKDPTIKGFRVQVLSAGSRAEVNKVKSQFYNLFPDIKSFIIYQQPNFKLRVGNFRTKLEAYKAWQEVIKYFPSAFITPDEIKLSEL